MSLWMCTIIVSCEFVAFAITSKCCWLYKWIIRTASKTGKKATHNDMGPFNYISNEPKSPWHVNGGGN